MKISDISTSERPREKLLARGPQALGNAELLAILLRTGTRDANVLDLAHRLLSSAQGNLTALAAFPALSPTRPRRSWPPSNWAAVSWMRPRRIRRNPSGRRSRCIRS